MISFKSFLAESKSAPLYHGTDFANGIGILYSGVKPKTAHFNKKLLKFHRKNDADKHYSMTNGVSLTRSKPFAIQWANSVDMNNNYGKGSDSIIVLEFNQLMLSQNFQVKPIQYWSGSGARVPAHVGSDVSNEFEEFVITDKILSTKYITKCHYYISLQSGRTPIDSADNALYMAGMLKEAKKRNPHIKFIPLPGSGDMD